MANQSGSEIWQSLSVLETVLKPVQKAIILTGKLFPSCLFLTFPDEIMAPTLLTAKLLCLPIKQSSR